jgi:poly(3-hydroxybutyrate) depolymerase
MYMMRKMLVLLLPILLLASCGSKEDMTPEPREKGGTLQFDSGPLFQNKIIPVHYFVPVGDEAQMPFLIVMHGADRNPREYLASWASKAREYKVIVIAPEFSEADFNSVQYNEGNYMTSGSVNPPEATTFSLIDKIFDFVKAD